MSHRMMSASLCAAGLGVTLASADQPAAPHWDYAGSDGPSAWATLSPHYAQCGRGTRQSPIDLPLTLHYEAATVEQAALDVFRHEHAIDVHNNGHTIEVQYDDGDRLQLGERSYRLVQYHFHAPSEHTVAGQHFPMELHLVHRADDGELAVVAVFLEEGPTNPGYAPVWNHLPKAPGRAEHVEHVGIDIDDLLPASRRAFAYIGSLTTPPCSEGVHWLVLRTPEALGVEQIRAFSTVLGHNSRPVQADNGRSLHNANIILDGR